MTSQPKASEPPRRPGETGFDPADDLSDAAAFDRALDDLLPKGDLAGSSRVDIDPEDFEAFNRELDAQMAQARARAGRFDLIEDLGVDVVEAPLAEPAASRAAEAPAPPPAATDEPALSEDLVTLTSTPPPVEPKTPPTPEAPPSPAEPPAPATPAANEVTPAPRVGRTGIVAVMLGLAGLFAGIAALWLSLDRHAELVHLRAALSEQGGTPSPPVPAPSRTPSDPAEIRALEARVEELSRQLAALSAPASAPAPTAGPPAQPEPAAAAPVAAALTTKAPPANSAASDRGSAPSPPAAQDPGVAEGPAPAPTAPAAAPTQAVLKPSGSGPWAVVIDSYAAETDAEQRRAQVARMGVPAEVRWFLVKDAVRYRVIVPGYATQDAANNAAAELRRRKAGGAWVMRLPKQE